MSNYWHVTCITHDTLLMGAQRLWDNINIHTCTSNTIMCVFETSKCVESQLLCGYWQSYLSCKPQSLTRTSQHTHIRKKRAHARGTTDLHVFEPKGCSGAIHQGRPVVGPPILKHRRVEDTKDVIMDPMCVCAHTHASAKQGRTGQVICVMRISSSINVC
jgi:hypothetical protein